MDAPALPQPGVADFLRDVCASGGDWSTLALSACRSLIMERPPGRAAALAVVLDAASGADADIRQALLGGQDPTCITSVLAARGRLLQCLKLGLGCMTCRNKAVRLTANRLYSEPMLQADIEAFATRKLRELIRDPQQDRRGRKQPARTEDSTEQELPSPQTVAGEPSSAPVQEPGGSRVPLPHSDSAASAPAEYGLGRTREDLQDGRGAESAAKAADVGSGQEKSREDDEQTERRNSGTSASTSEKSESRRPRMQLNGSTDPMTGGQMPDTGVDGKMAANCKAGGEDVEPVSSVEGAQQRCDLFCALCTKKHDLLHMLLEVFGKVLFSPCLLTSHGITVQSFFQILIPPSLQMQRALLCKCMQLPM
jgi:hypothetical protein